MQRIMDRLNQARRLHSRRGTDFPLHHKAMLVLSLGLFLMSPSDATAATCGAEGQRPCKVWERVPSCNSGLAEDFSKGLCIRPRKSNVATPKPKPPLNCGREGQRPCRVTERIPSCDQGLVEDFAKGRCARPVAAVQPPSCGREGQRPCKVTERIPSCDQGLVEDFARGRCARPVAAAQPPSCGREGQRPCRVTERIPSCDQGLVEDFARGRCARPVAAAQPPSCGREGQRPCLVTERIPSCDKGLVEDMKNGRCIALGAPSCGREGQRPCLVTERIPSCDQGLYEDFKVNRCRTLPPGKTAWSASFDSMSAGVMELGRICSDFLNNAGSGVVRELHKVPVVFNAPHSAKNSATLAANANLRFGTGFMCGVWPYASGLLEEVSFAANSPKMAEAAASDAERRLAAFARAFHKSYNEIPCSELTPIGVRPLCAVVKALPAEAAGQCMNGLLKKVEDELNEIGGKGSFDEAKYLDAMELGGNMAYAAALDAAIGAATAGVSEGIKPDKLEKIKKVYDFFQDLREAFGALQKAQQSSDAMRGELSAIPACRPLVN